MQLAALLFEELEDPVPRRDCSGAAAEVIGTLLPVKSVGIS